MMSMSTDSARRFSVHPRHEARHGARVVVEASFEAAAIAFAQDFVPAGSGNEAEAAVIVRDLETGVEHCFRIDLDTGETAACG
jgi:hypothetical protein